MPVPVAAWSKTWVCGRSPAGIVGSSPPGGMDVSVVSVVMYRSHRRADHTSRGVLPTVMCRCVLFRNLKNEEAMTRIGPQRHRGKKNVHKPWRNTVPPIPTNLAGVC